MPDGTQHAASTYTIDSADTWEKKIATIAGNTTQAISNDNTAGLYVRFIHGTGSNWASGTQVTSWASLTDANRHAAQAVNLADSTSNYMNITGVQLEVGKIATPFEHRSYGEELALCQRYYYNHVNAINDYVGVGDYYVTTQLDVDIPFPVSMRTAPTLEQSSGTNYYQAYGGAMSTYVSNSWTLWEVSGSNTSATMYVTPDTNGTAGHAMRVIARNSNARISFTAEL
jgi:hypothetical protein